MFQTTTAESNVIGDILPVSYRDAIRNLGHATYTLFNTPEHEKMHRLMEDTAVDDPAQPLQPPSDTIAHSIYNEVLADADPELPYQIPANRLVQLSSVLMQFTDYVPDCDRAVAVPYVKVDTLHKAVNEKALEKGPLNYHEQLDVALTLNDGDVMESLWQLFITSRVRARWLDSKVLTDAPELSRNEKLDTMLEWRRAVAACKEPGADRAQDPSGDTYYTWTHALANVALTHGPQKPNMASQAATVVFGHGTTLMHSVVHRISRQGVKSNHTTAAVYGNAIGRACSTALAANMYPRQMPEAA